MSKKQPEGIEIFGDAATPVSSKSNSKATSQSKSTSTSVAKSSAKSSATSTSTAKSSSNPDSARRKPWLGVVALVIALALAGADAYAIAVAIGDYYELAILLAIVATIGTVIAFLLGAAALVLGRGRWWGVAAMVLSVFANPFTLVQLLVFFSDFTAS